MKIGLWDTLTLRPRRSFWAVLALRTGKAAEGYTETADGNAPPARWRTKPESADVVASLAFGDPGLFEDPLHFPVLDLDNIPLALEDSSTPGHTHLFIDQPCRWSDYVKLLQALADCGYLEQGYVDASLERGHTAVRLRADKHGPAPDDLQRVTVERGRRLSVGPRFPPPAPVQAVDSSLGF